MPLLVGSIAALVALAAAILAQVHWQFALMRGGIALIVGWILGAVWQAAFAQLAPLRRSEETQGKDE